MFVIPKCHITDLNELIGESFIFWDVPVVPSSLLESMLVSCLAHSLTLKIE
jgi:hypothetical protein